MILSFCILILFIFYTSGGFKKLMDFYRYPEPEPLQKMPGPNKSPEPIPEPGHITAAPATVETITKPEPIPEPEPIKPAGDRRQLERIAANCLTAAGCKFDVWTFCRFKSDLELMEIIKDYNLNK